MTPPLPRVNHLIAKSNEEIKSLILTVWLLLAPNLRRLDLVNFTIFNKIELAKELSDMLDENDRLKSIFDHIERMIIFETSNKVDEQTKHELLLAFGKVFTKAVIC